MMNITKGVSMSETKRSTRICTIDELNKKLSIAIRVHFKKFNLGDIESSILMGCETTSVQQKKGVFGGSEEAISAVLVSPKWLVWAECVNNKVVDVNSAMLKQIEIHDYASSAMGTISPDTGMNVTGRYSDVSKTGQAFIGVGMDAAGIKFRATLQDAMNTASSK
jgi:hypothetical protein